MLALLILPGFLVRPPARPGRLHPAGPAAAVRGAARGAGRAVRDDSLEIAVENAAGPWSLPDGTGFANDVVRAAFAAVDVDVRLRVVPYARCKQMVADGIVVGCFSMSRLPALDSTVLFPSTPLFVCVSDYFQSASKGIPARRAGDLHRGTVVGVVLGYEYPASVYELQKQGILVLESAGSEEINLRKLADGRIDAALVNHNEIKTADYMIARAGVAGKVVLAFRAGVLPSYIGFSRKHPGGATALAQFNDGIRIITANGVLKRLEKKWADRARAEAQAIRGAGAVPGGLR